jgi:hypothetical protein
MHTIRRSRSSFMFITTLLAGALFAPVSVNAEDQVLALAPVAGPSWDEASGYRSVEASRIATDVRDQPDAVAAVATGTWDEMSGYASVEASRVISARQGLLSADLGSLQEEALYAVVAAGITWDETSGYASVEVNRATQ